MKEKFFKLGYSNYLQKSKKKKRTSLFVNKILEHKVVFSILLIVITCTAMNCWLVYRFMSVLSGSF